jgi:hypothetical protein
VKGASERAQTQRRDRRAGPAHGPTTTRIRRTDP